MKLVLIPFFLFSISSYSQEIRFREFERFEIESYKDSLVFKIEAVLDSGFRISTQNVVGESSEFGHLLLDHILRNRQVEDMSIDEKDRSYFAALYLYDKKLDPIRTSPFIHGNPIFNRENSVIVVSSDTQKIEIKIVVDMNRISSYSIKRLRRTKYFHFLMDTYDKDGCLTNFLIVGKMLEFPSINH